MSGPITEKCFPNKHKVCHVMSCPGVSCYVDMDVDVMSRVEV